MNDFDEAATLPYTQDLVRLGASALVAIEESRLTLSGRSACEAILEGYADALRQGGGPAVLAERYRWLRDLTIVRLKDQRPYWDTMRGLRSASGRVPPAVRRLLQAAMPERGLDDPRQAVQLHDFLGAALACFERRGEAAIDRPISEVMAASPTTVTRGTRVGDAVTSRNIHSAIFDSLRLCHDI